MSRPAPSAAPLLAALLLAGCGSSRAPSPPAASPTPAAAADVVDLPGAPRVDPAAMARALHAAVNEARRREGLGAVAWADTLAETAQVHSDDMAARDYINHVSPDGDDPNDRAGRLGLRCRIPLNERETRVGVLENLALMWLYGSVHERTRGGQTTTTYDWLTSDAIVERTVQGWLDSPTHRVNLLDTLVTREGLGVTLRPDGAVYVTQVLC